MEITTYANRLSEWNSHEKYQQELLFLERLLNLKDNEYVLDYGCGIGSCVEYFRNNYNAKTTGFDVNLFDEIKRKEWFEKDIKGPYKKVYFMHSLAHIPDADDMLIKLKTHLFEENYIIVITPNKEFDDYYKNLIKDKKYDPDSTVVKHFTSKSLSQLFQNNGYKIITNGQFGKLENGHFERLFLLASLIKE